ncbi:MAG: phage terminase large subunit [Peptoanaerobacter stomatis]|uniref:phage terminase large subunit n=1 Tax=Peptoanaerobacter stomatis TaxID=796937 RepID=UPI003FA177FB
MITIAKETATGYMYVEDADVERRHPDKIIFDIIEKARRIQKQYKAKYKVFGAETNQFQWFLKEQLAKESARQGVYLPIQEVNQSSDKVLRIQTLQPDIKNRYIKFNKNHKRLLEQLKFFPMADHDDAPDALESCRTLATSNKKKLKLLNKKLFGF